MTTFKDDVEELLIKHTEYNHFVDAKLIDMLITNNKLRLATEDKFYSDEIVRISKQLWRQTGCEIPASVFRSILNMCFEVRRPEPKLYIGLLRCIKIGVYDENFNRKN